MISTLLILVMIMSLAAACGSKNEENNTGNKGNLNPGSESANNPVNEATKDPFEIALAMPIFGAIPPDMQQVQDEISKITKEKINATVKILPISIGAWAQQMNLMTSSGEKLDVSFVFGQGYSSDVATGKIIPLDNLLEQYGQGIKEQIGPDFLASAKVEGNTYGVPTYKDYTTGVPGVLMRKDLVDKYNIDVASIKGMDDLDPIFQIIKENEPNLAPLAVGLSTPADKYVWYDKLGDRFGVLPNYDNGLKVINVFETKEYENLMKKLHSWFKAGYINKDAATSQTPPTDLVKADKAFAYIDGNKVGGVESFSQVVGKELVFAPLVPNSYSTTSDVLAGLWTISSNSTNPERTMMFLDLMYTDKDLANLFVWGIEGKHYVKASDTTIEYPQGIDSTSVGYVNQRWITPNASLAYLQKYDFPQLWVKTAEVNQNAVKSKALGFLFNAEPVKNEMTSLNNVIEQYRKALESGSLDPEAKLQEFRDKLKAAGIDKVIAEKQKQLDAWAAATTNK